MRNSLKSHSHAGEGLWAEVCSRRKPKNLKKSLKTLVKYIAKYKAGIFVVMFCAACSTVFTVAGPKILGEATTALSEGSYGKDKRKQEALILIR